jgi:glutamate dehydrogenase/leucine dehydrogenase
MNVLAQMNAGKHEQVVFVQDLEAGLRAIIAIHSTMLGPALGGTRMYPYATEEQALRDVLDLSRGMTLQGRRRWLGPRWWQGRHHRRSSQAQI